MNAVQLPKKFLEKYPVFAGQIAHLRYARNNDNRPVGVVLVDDQGFIGYSMVNFKAGDRFDKVKGIRKAIYRLGSRKTLNNLKQKFYPNNIMNVVNRSRAYTYNALAMYAAIVEVEKWQGDTE